MERRSDVKAQLIYDEIDRSNEFYYTPIGKTCRSRIVIPFRIGGREANVELEKKFLAEAQDMGMMHLNGHWRVGGIRASLYNAITIEETQMLADHMRDFYERHRND